MIDFRYHVVTIVSIFLALAVGIVLGAGPLQAGIGTALGQQITNLRQDKSDLNAQLNAAQADLAAAREYAAQVETDVVAGRLAGTSVVIVTLPNADSGVLPALQQALDRAGASVTGTVTLSSAWFDNDLAARTAVATQAAAALDADGAAAPSLDGQNDPLGAVLARCIVSKDATPVVPSSTPNPSSSASSSPTTSSSTISAPVNTRTSSAPTSAPTSAPSTPASSGAALALQTLGTADLLDVSDPQIAPAQNVVVISGVWTGTAEVVAARTAAVRTLLATLAGSANATVVAADLLATSAGAQSASDAVQAVRQDPAVRRLVSTVDHAREGRGPALVVLALADQLAGEIGQYGTSTGADAPIPQVTR